MEHELIKRYIYAVVRHLPQKARAEVERELDSLISDMLETRCGAVLPTEKDLRIVLTELGTPEELAVKYSGEEQRALISGTYLLLYKRVLRIVLPILAAVVMIAGVMALLFGEPLPANPYLLVGRFFAQCIGGAFSGVVNAFAIITFIFAILERKKVKLPEGDMFARLPAVPQEQTRIKPHDAIMGIVWAFIFTVLFLAVPWFAGVYLEGVGWIPVFVTETVRGFWLPIILWGLLGIGKEVAKLIEGQYTKRLAVVTVVADVLMLVCLVAVFSGSGIVNPVFLSNIAVLFEGEGAKLIPLFANLHLVVLGALSLTLLLEIVTTLVKAFKYDVKK